MLSPSLKASQCSDMGNGKSSPLLKGHSQSKLVQVANPGLIFRHKPGVFKWVIWKNTGRRLTISTAVVAKQTNPANTLLAVGYNVGCIDMYYYIRGCIDI